MGTKTKQARADDAVNARCRHLLHILYKMHGPRGGKCKLVPFNKFAALSAKEVRDTWDFSDRILMHHVAKALEAYRVSQGRYSRAKDQTNSTPQ